MARSRDEFNQVSRQESQLQHLRNIDKSLKDSVANTSNISSSMSVTEVALSSAAAAIMRTSAALEMIYQSLESPERFQAFQDNLASRTEELMRDIQKKVNETIEGTRSSIEDQIAEAERQANDQREGNRRELRREEEERKEARDRAIDHIESRALDLFEKLGGIADKLSESSNNLIQITGASATEVRGTRSEVMDIVDRLNEQTGNYFDATETYARVVDMARSSGIGDLEVLEDITRPILLASESMDVSTEGIASLLSRWNTRYNFSSLAMEQMVDEIRGNTAGNNATAEATLRNLKTLDNWMAYYSKGDEDKLSSMVEEISTATSWLESMGVDTSRYTEYLGDIASGSAQSNSQLIQVLNAAGISAQQAQELFSEGNMKELYKSLFQGEVSIFKELDDRDIGLLEQSLSARGMDVNQMLDSYTASIAENFKDLSQFETSTGETTAAETIEDKYVSFMDKASNLFSSMNQYLANIQESLGIGLADIAGVYVLGKGFIKGFDILSKGLGVGATSGGLLSSIAGALGVGGAGAAGGGIAATLAPLVLPILGVGAAFAVGGGVIWSIYDTIKDAKELSDKNFKELIDATNGASEDQMMMMVETAKSVDGKIEKSYSMQSVSASEYNEEEHLANIEKARQQSQSDRSWWNKIWGDSATIDISYALQKAYSNFYNGLTKEEKMIVDIYTNPNKLNLATEDKNLRFLMNNFSEIESLYNEGLLATELNSNGLKDTVARDMLGYEVGTNYINQDQVAVLHEGEAVVPKKYNPAANMTELEMLREQARTSQLKQATERDESLNYIKETMSTLADIKEFLSYWRDDNIKRENAAANRNKFAASSRFLNSYLVEG